MNLQSIDPSSA